MKNCPYCAEEIQDAAIVCKHCGRDLAPVNIAAPPVLPIKKKTPALMVVLVSLVLLCFCALVFIIIGNSFNTSSPNPIIVTPLENIVATKLPTLQPRPELGLDLTQFVSKYDSMTDIQKESFIGESTGKWVSWSGEIFDVNDDGTILINIPGTLVSTVNLRGVSQAEAINLTKGTTIHFTGRISDVIDILGLSIYLEDVQLTP